jgi:radical SAM protein with 4Fe4S-binding SPASM domain
MADRVLGGVPDREVTVNVTGGEPLLLPGIRDLLAHLHAFANLDEIVIITNGTVASEATLDMLRALPKVTTLKVSLEGATPAVNDAMRGEGSFRRVLENIPRLASAGKDIVLMITLSRHNAGEIEAFARLARDSGVAGVVFERFVPLGQGKGLMGSVLGPRDWADAVRAIAAAAGIDADPMDLLPYKAFWLSTAPAPGEEPLAGALCNLGDESMALMPDGSVFPCRRMALPIGNVLADPFDEILRRLASFESRRLKPRLTGIFCTSCGIEECSGCRALARSVCGDPLSDDPQCPLLA